MRSIVIMPTYNERNSILQLIDAVLALPENLDVLVVDDSSPDGTADLVATHYRSNDQVHILVRTGPRGFAPAYIEAFAHVLSRGYEYIFSMDADLSHDPASLPQLMKALEMHDVVVGSRYLGNRISVVNWPILRLLLSIAAGVYVRGITGLRISDPTSGFRGFRAGVLSAIGLNTIRSNGYSFLVETLYRVSKCRFHVAEVPIVFTERRSGQSKMSRRIIFEAVLMPWRLRLGSFQMNTISPEETGKESSCD